MLWSAIHFITYTIYQKNRPNSVCFFLLFVCKKGYVRKNGAIDYPRFYNLAQIPQPTWSRYFNATNKDAPVDAILKIVLALRLPTQEAMDFMTSAGAGFYSGNERDTLILAFIDSDYLGLTDIEEIQNKVFDILECFLRETKAGSFENLYDFWSCIQFWIIKTIRVTNRLFGTYMAN